MAETSAGSSQVQMIQEAYLAQTQRKRLYGFLMLVIFFFVMVAGFNTAAARNGGSFWGGIDNFFDYPAEVVAEAASKASELPGHFLTFLPALIETVNIAAVSTLIGALFAIVLSLLSTRGLARFPRLIGL
ncbi:MAG: phosphonate ABC transporter, permease protein PhnE, partial [Cognatishimia sp.]